MRAGRWSVRLLPGATPLSPGALGGAYKYFDADFSKCEARAAME